MKPSEIINKKWSKSIEDCPSEYRKAMGDYLWINAIMTYMDEQHESGLYYGKPRRIETWTTYEMAEWLHNLYENESKKAGWETQKKCRVSFEDLPKENKRVMINVAAHLFVELLHIPTRRELDGDMSPPVPGVDE